ncbi:YheC/YheD family protein [Lederbergia citri]|uniref:YheC/YheD family protein n=1 Tax=Lederbergia citri TaxID=2833580 RepID=A0A942YFX2_9BACI|nr:YheC/YheD family protein [Lederbergia citri]MBS4194942.1 YheC/YheD family protein [Lederbergia citri]
MAYFVNNKWKKYSILKENEALHSHLPDTRKFSESTLWDIVDKESKVILKPSGGFKGRNIYKLSSLGDDKYEIHYKDRKDLFIGRDQTYAYLEEKMGSRNYLIQSYISLLKINQSPLDIRVIVQKCEDSGLWIVTGKVAKLAGDGFFVTNNGLSGGTTLPIEKAIHESLLVIPDNNLNSLLSEIDRITLLATDSLGRYYKKQRIFGFDIGLDTHGHIWIIEANLRPSMSHFYKLKDKTMYWKIKNFHKNKK